MNSRRSLLLLAVLLGCAVPPSGPSVMVLPGTRKDFDEFRYDDAVCREWAGQQTGTTAKKAATEAGVSSAAIGTVVGAASGAAIGAAAGNPALGAAVGSGVGLLGGSAVGAGRADATQWTLQQRYDASYMQCMYAKGNQIPVPAGSRRSALNASQGSEHAREDLPPPPPGRPPPPPPGRAPPPPPGRPPPPPPSY